MPASSVVVADADLVARCASAAQGGPRRGQVVRERDVAVGRDLLAGEHGVDRQEAEAVDATGMTALDAVGVVDRAAEDLAAAADPEDPARCGDHGPVEAAY